MLNYIDGTRVTYRIPVHNRCDMLATRENGSATAGYKATTPSTLPPSQHSVKHLHVSSSISAAISE